MSRSRIMPEIKECLHLAIPLATAQLAQSATGFVDTIMTGMLGSETLAAGGLGAVLFTFLLTVSTAMISAVSPLAAEAHGADHPQRVTAVVRQGLWLSLLLTLPLMLIMLNGTPLLRSLGQNPDTIAQAQTYLSAIAWGYFPALAFATLRFFVAALSKPRSILVIVVIGTLLNMMGNYVLMFGKFGFPVLGLAGIGWSSAFSFWAMFGALSIYILRQPTFNRYNVFRDLHQFEAETFRALLNVGMPIGGMVAVEAGLFTMTTFLMGQLGTVTLAAHQIALQSAAVSFNLPLGISFATTIRVGQRFGQQSLAPARLAGFVGIGLGGLSMGVASLLFIALPGGFGTFEEFCEILTWAQLGLHHKPQGLLNIAGYYDPLLQLFDRAVDEQFLRADLRNLVLQAPDPDSLLDQFQHYQSPKVEKWVDLPIKPEQL